MPQFEDLEYAAQYAGELHAALRAAGYDAELVVDPAVLGAKQLGERVEEHLAGGGVAVVHVLSHGEHTRDGGVYVIGSDATRSRDTRVGEWRIAVTDEPTAPMTLFLLDLCHAGAVNQHWQPPEPTAYERAWVIAATGAGQPAYAGRLTRAATAVINDIVSGELDLAPTVRTVGFDMLFTRISRQVQELARKEGGYQQDPVATPVMGAQPELPFFDNPRYRPNPAAEAGAAVEPATEPFLDPALDEEHFRDRAAGHGPAASRVTAGCFTGRAPQLRRLAPWMDGEGPGGLIVVTGSPGAGKSALLGLLVCAAHPDLRGATQDLWRAAAARPSENPELAAVHARQRTLPVILASLTAQLDLDSGVAAEGGLSPALVIDAITRRVRPPVIVVDAVDEAPDHQQIVTELLIPLARKRRGDGAPACRLLIGIRPWGEFASLLELANRIGEIIDLDRIPVEQRRRDVADYVTGLLELLPGYATATHSAGRRAFAEAVAEALVPEPTIADVPEPPRWGEFLVASLYTHTVSLRGSERMSDPAEAARLGSAVPRTLPEVLELDLAARPASGWRPAVLTALAQARGAGMPRSALLAVSATIAGEQDAPPVQQVGKELDALRFYLRTSADSDGSALYRFFHQGLADHLHGGGADDPVGIAGQVLDGLLATLVVVRGDRRWDLAEPYLLRHAAQHAADAGRVDELLVDPEFLVHADPTTLIPALDHADAAAARLATAVYRVSAGGHPHRSTHQRRNVLGVDAARYGAATLLAGLIATPEAHRSRWRPRWASGSQVSTALRATLAGHTEPVLGVACTRLAGRWVAVTGSGDATVRIWDLITGSPVGDPLIGHTAKVTAVACTELEGRPVAVTGGEDATIRIWDLATGALIRDPLLGHRDTVAALADSHLDGHPVAITGSADGTVRVWDLTTGSPIGPPLTGHTSTVRAVACAELDGHPIAVTGGEDATIRIWDLRTGAPIGEPMTGHTDTVTAVACAERAGRPIAVTGGADATVRIWDLTTGTPTGRVLTGHTGVVQVVVCVELAGRLVAVTGGADATVRIWDLTTIGTPVGLTLTGHTGWVAAMSCTQLHGHPVAVTGSWDRTVRIWDLVTGTPIGDSRAGHTATVTAVACAQLSGRRVAVTGSWDTTVRIWDLRTGTPVAAAMTGHSGWVAAVACAELAGRPVAVTGGGDATVRIWDLTTGTPVAAAMTGHSGWVAAVACAELAGRPVAVTGGGDATVRIWDLTTSTPIGKPLTGHIATIRAVACTQLNGRPIAVTGGEDATVRIWDLATGMSIGEPLTGHNGTVSGLACTQLDGRPVAMTTGADATLRIWDLAGRRQVGESLTGPTGRVSALAGAQLGGRPVAMTTGADATLRIWDLAERRQVDEFSLPTAAGSVAVSSLGEVVLGLDWDVVVLE